MQRRLILVPTPWQGGIAARAARGCGGATKRSLGWRPVRAWNAGSARLTAAG